MLTLIITENEQEIMSISLILTKWLGYNKRHLEFRQNPISENRWSLYTRIVKKYPESFGVFDSLLLGFISLYVAFHLSQNSIFIQFFEYINWICLIHLYIKRKMLILKRYKY